MKRFMVFVGETYYPNPGMEDFKEDFSDPFEAIRFAQKLFFSDLQCDWFQVYDLDQKKILLEKRYDYKTFEIEKEQFLKTNLDLLPLA